VRSVSNVLSKNLVSVAYRILAIRFSFPYQGVNFNLGEKGCTEWYANKKGKPQDELSKSWLTGQLVHYQGRLGF